ncbi:MAG: Zn-dependent exopeptidase M28 [Nanoarchaeota archaeon]|nr:Zn-dependent exopeptidase M28 [Nanoarchaeota archaeon]
MLLDIVRELEGKSREDRREVIVHILKEAGVEPVFHRYRSGINIFVPSKRDLEIGISSHYDAVPKSPGANDNGSAIAVTLDVLQRFHANPLTRIGVRYFFFDEEEKNLKGSLAYVHDYEAPTLIGLYNMEMVGAGDRLALWDVSDEQKSILLNTLEEQALLRDIPTYRFRQVMFNAADHRAFTMAGMVDAFTLTLLSEGDMAAATRYLEILRKKKRPNVIDAVRSWNFIQKSPLFQNYHKPTDTSDHLREDALQLVSDLLYDSILYIDQNEDLTRFEDLADI